ncbi:MAG: trigger factor, partial [Gammaproteobacteria bacterium]|nr:trigger factor [Gammaproteobacteria bacterium]
MGDLKFATPDVEITDGDVDDVIDRLRDQRAEFETVERKAEKDDRIVVDFVGTIDGETFEGGEGNEVPILVGAGQVIEDFDKALVGLAAGDTKAAKVKFPKDYPAEDLAGKKAVFDITALRVERKVLPDLDDAFAETVGVEEGGVEALRTDVRSNMERELDARKRRSELKRRAFDSLLAANAVDLPKALIEDEISSLQTAAMQQLGIKDAEKAPPRENFREHAERRAALGLLVQELIRSREIEVDASRVNERIDELSAGYENPQQA